MCASLNEVIPNLKTTVKQRMMQFFYLDMTAMAKCSRNSFINIRLWTDFGRAKGHLQNINSPLQLRHHVIQMFDRLVTKKWKARGERNFPQ